MTKEKLIPIRVDLPEKYYKKVMKDKTRVPSLRGLYREIFSNYYDNEDINEKDAMWVSQLNLLRRKIDRQDRTLLTIFEMLSYFVELELTYSEEPPESATERKLLQKKRERRSNNFYSVLASRLKKNTTTLEAIHGLVYKLKKEELESEDEDSDYTDETNELEDVA